MKTLVIIGAGKGIGLSIAKKFGQNDFRVALVARNEGKLKDMVAELKDLNIESSYYIADILDKNQIESAISKIKLDYKTIDVVEFSPSPTEYPPTSVLELASENAVYCFESYALSSINIVNLVVKDMIENGSGALLFTTGFSSINPFPMMGNYGVGLGALRNYITNLHNELKDKGIFVGHRALALMVTEPGTGEIGDPNVIADMWYDSYVSQDVWEQEYPKGITAEILLAQAAQSQK